MEAGVSPRETEKKCSRGRRPEESGIYDKGRPGEKMEKLKGSSHSQGMGKKGKSAEGTRHF